MPPSPPRTTVWGNWLGVAVAGARTTSFLTGDDGQISRVRAPDEGSGKDLVTSITVAILRRMLEAAPPGLGGTRDRALLLIGLAGALRRNELAALGAET